MVWAYLPDGLTRIAEPEPDEEDQVEAEEPHELAVVGGHPGLLKYNLYTVTNWPRQQQISLKSRVVNPDPVGSGTFPGSRIIYSGSSKNERPDKLKFYF